MVLESIIPLKSLTTEQMAFVVEAYIKDVKGVDVTINLTKQYINFLDPRLQLNLLSKAYNDACKYFIDKLNLKPEL